MTAISEMHKRSVLHNDLDQASVFFDDKLHPTCTDFGFAKPILEHANGQEHVRVGCRQRLGYDAPETTVLLCNHSSKLGWVSTKGDVYAAAAIAFHGLFAPNLQVVTTSRIDWSHKVEEYTRLQPHPANQLVLDLYRQCLENDPHMRPSAAKALQAAERCAKLICLSHYNPDDSHGARYIGKGDDWRTYDWTADQKRYSFSLQAWHGLTDDSMHC
jgi:serine/threonine protein kinase